MENEKKGNKVLEIILIVLVALSFVLIPLLNQYKNKTISLNNTLLVKQESQQVNGIDITDLKYNDVRTIIGSFSDLEISDGSFNTNMAYGGASLVPMSDVFGFGVTNNFRFTKTDLSVSGFYNVFCLEYYFSTDNGTLIFPLNYYEITSNMGVVEIRKIPSNSLNSSVKYSILNFIYYNSNNYSKFNEYLLSIPVLSILRVSGNFQLPTNIDANIKQGTTTIYNFSQDYITDLLSSARQEGYRDGYKDGEIAGINSSLGNSSSNVFSVLKNAASAISAFMNIEVLPNISMWLLISIPLSISIMIIILRLLRGGS